MSTATTSKISRYVYLALCFVIVCYVLWYAGTLPIIGMEAERAAILYVGFACAVLMFDSFMGRSRTFGIRRPLVNKSVSLILLVLALVCCTYFFLEYYNILYYRAATPNIYDMVLGAIAVIIVLECCRKNVEKWIMIIALAFMVIAIVRIPIPVPYRIFSPLSLLAEVSAKIDGIFGMLTVIAFTWISAFVVFASFLRALGGYDTLFNLMRYMASRGPHLVPQTGVVASALFGMFSGSAPANVAGTGMFTIPMNKRIGVPAKFAGAIEAVASSGGLIVPPVMGAAAFIMASLLGRHYIEICAIAVLPAIVYYTATGVAVFAITRKYLDLNKAILFLREMPPTRISYVLRIGVPFMLGIAILIFLMAYYRLDPLYACFYTIVTYIVFAFIYNYLAVFKATKKEPFKNYLKEFGERLCSAIEEGGTLAATVGVMLATIGIISTVLTSTGLAIMLPRYLVAAVGGSLPLLVLVTWFIATILGFGVSATAVYIISLALVAVAFTLLGVPPLLFHFFIFWIAVLSAITPPVAIAAATAAKIAQEKFWSIAIESMKIGLPLFLLCFGFFTWPELLVWSKETPIAFVCLLVTSIAMPVGIYGLKAFEELIKSRMLNMFVRALLVLLSFTIMLLRPLLPPYVEYVMVVVTAAIAFFGLAREAKMYSIELGKIKVAISS